MYDWWSLNDQTRTLKALRDDREGSAAEGLRAQGRVRRDGEESLDQSRFEFAGAYAPTPRELAVTASLVRQSLVMSIPSASMVDLARKLVALEATNQTAPESHMNEAVRVCEKLRISLTRFAGADGFTALLRRALVLARVDVPSLQSVNVKADGRLEGLAELLADGTMEETPAGIAIIAHLLGLLVTFIGEGLALRLLRKAWPAVSPDEWHSRSESL